MGEVLSVCSSHPTQEAHEHREQEQFCAELCAASTWCRAEPTHSPLLQHQDGTTGPFGQLLLAQPCSRTARHSSPANKNIKVRLRTEFLPADAASLQGSASAINPEHERCHNEGSSQAAV